MPDPCLDENRRGWSDRLRVHTLHILPPRLFLALCKDGCVRDCLRLQAMALQTALVLQIWRSSSALFDYVCFFNRNPANDVHFCWRVDLWISHRPAAT